MLENLKINKEIKKMKIVKKYKGFVIKQLSDKDKKELNITCNYKLYLEDEEIWEVDSIREAVEFIDCYNKD